MNEAHVLGVLGALAERLELGSAHALTVSQRLEGGVSVGMVLPESHLTLHTFAARRCVCLSIFSRRELGFGGVLDTLREGFGVGRLESHLGSRSTSLPQEAESARSHLVGERNYTDVRLDDALLEGAPRA